MKDKPTELDREAAGLFKPADGALAWSKYMRGRVLRADEHGEGGLETVARVVALDTDDPATVGVMLAQVEAACGANGRVDMFAYDGGVFCAVADGDGIPDDAGTIRAEGPTRGAALVAAMRAIKGAADV